MRLKGLSLLLALTGSLGANAEIVGLHCSITTPEGITYHPVLVTKDESAKDSDSRTCETDIVEANYRAFNTEALSDGPVFFKLHLVVEGGEVKKEAEPIYHVMISQSPFGDGMGMQVRTPFATASMNSETLPSRLSAVGSELSDGEQPGMTCSIQRSSEARRCVLKQR